jgi:hypothetical protein
MEIHMGLARYALAFGLGFAFGHPAGREKLRTLPGQVTALAKRPEVQQLQEKGKAVAGQAVQTAKDKVGKQSSSNGVAGTGETVVLTEVDATSAAPTGRPARTGDPEAATHGTLPPSGPGRSS